jgi:glutamyl-tRNA synthetase
MAEQIRVRIPPSPTGNLHVGTARTALFNYLFAKKKQGTIVLRLEDTDRERSKTAFEQNIIEGLTWLGITWDEGPHHQSERGELYQAATKKLLAEGKAYQVEDGQAIKLKIEPQVVEFEDVIRGKIKTHTDSFEGDFVIARSLTDALYHLAVVVDDAEMKITHVIRGEDHLSNTAKHILLQRALGYSTPVYAHLPLLVDANRRKLSKRAGDTDLLSYRHKGYLPEAMVNYLALLGWSPKTDQEFFAMEELIKAFSLEGIQKGSAFFSIEKLEAINKLHLRSKDGSELKNITAAFSAMQGIDLPDYVSEASLAAEQQRVGNLQDLLSSQNIFDPKWKGHYDPELLIWRKDNKKQALDRLAKAKAFIEALPEEDFSQETLEKKILAWIDDNNLGRGETLWPLRVALTGREHSPGPFEVAAVIGPKETTRRIEAALAILKP